MEFSKKDWEHVSHNFYGLPISHPILERYPDLDKIFGNIKAITHVQKEPMFRFIIAMYNRNSPIRKIDDVMLRVKEAALMAGFKLNANGKFSTGVEEFLLGKEERGNKLIIDYVKYDNGTTYTLLIGLEQSLYVRTIELMSGKYTKDTTQVLEDIKSQIEKAKDQLLSDTIILDLRKALYASVEKSRIELSPEALAEKERNGENPLPGVEPFGEGYELQTE